MAIKITENGVVNYENSPDVNRKLFPNLNICGKEIGELAEEIDGKAPVIVNTASGPIASFSDGAEDTPLKSCVVSFGPIQEGTGDPGPENIRPISGRTGLSAVRCGKNLLPSLVDGTYSGNGVTAEVEDGVCTFSGTTTASGNAFIIPLSEPYIIPENAYMHYLNSVANASLAPHFEPTSNPAVGFGPTCSPVNRIFGMPNSAGITIERARFYISNGVTISGTFSPMICFTDSAIPYEPYKGSTYAVNWEAEAGTVYGGTFDVVSGKLTVDRAYIASYDGEVLPSTWISDRDVYADGTTPTTGAQVVYKLAEPIEYQLAPQEIRTLIGENNIWSNDGDVSVEFPADTKTYIDDLSIKTVEVTGQTPTITAEENTRYICGEVTSLSFTPCEKGICDVRFTAASISTVLTLPETVKLPDWFDPTLLEANTTYEINIVDGIYGVVMSWA